MHGDTSFKTKLHISSLLSCLKREKEAYEITKLSVHFQLKTDDQFNIRFSTGSHTNHTIFNLQKSVEQYGVCTHF
jgi:hypothetical protein